MNSIEKNYHGILPNAFLKAYFGLIDQGTRNLKSSQMYETFVEMTVIPSVSVYMIHR